MRSILFLSLVAGLALSGCGKATSPTTANEEPFSLKCVGNYGGPGLDDSKIYMKITLYPQSGRGMVFDVDGYDLSGKNKSSTYSGPGSLFRAEDVVSTVTRIDDTQIDIGPVKLYRKAGSFKVGALEGRCEKTSFVAKPLAESGQSF